MDVHEVLLWCFEQNYHADKMNAAIHCAPVRFSPLTFRLYEKLWAMIWPKGMDITQEMAEVRSHIGDYEEDPGR
jgi:hypothetical protein